MLPLFALAIVSAAGLAYEILLMRLFSIIQWHHFAYMILSLALLGFGASGTALSLAGRRAERHYAAGFAVNAALFGIASIACFALALRLPFNAEELLWDPAQPLLLCAVYALLALPFFFVANAVGLTLMAARERVGGAYAADLVGAGLGSLGIVLLLFAVFPHMALRMVAALGGIAAALACIELRWRPRTGTLAGLAVAAAAFLLPDAWLEPRPSPYKALSQALEVSGTRIVDERSSPLGMLTVIANERIPLRHAPGLSLNAPAEPPPQLGVFTDGDAMTAITRAGDAEPVFLGYLSSALPYHLARPGRVLVLGAAGGMDVLQALTLGAAEIHAVELNPQLIDLVRGPFADFAGHLYSRERVRVHTGEARGFIAASADRFDLIQLSALDSYAASSAGLYALNESYLYTVQAFEAYLDRLAPGGYLSVTRWIKLPPRDTLKLLATAVEALRARGDAEPGHRLVLIRGWQTSTLLVKNGFFGERELDALRDFCRTRSFDVAWYPGMTAAEANRYNILDRPYFYSAALALLGGGAERFYDEYKFNLRPATDDRPYFSNFFKWTALPEIVALRGQGGRALLEGGYLVLVATLAQALLASLVLIVLPLALAPGLGRTAGGGGARSRTLAYFGALGLAFLFLEIVFIQKLILVLHEPVYAAAVVLSAFLVFAGLGSAWTYRRRAAGGEQRRVARAALGIAVFCAADLLALEAGAEALGALPLVPRIAIAVAAIAPLAFLMGQPFPLGLAQLAREAPGRIPWAWAINGSASVISAVLATLLAIHFGLAAVAVLAVGLYALAALAFPGAGHRPFG
ncbi:MAG TPA: SAM-dependent methyltransferase [Gammaproteobacteria bacterium]|nr:SAM-dependent methyltransferase [Gammaproteobacteria bacterium]